MASAERSANLSVIEEVAREFVEQLIANLTVALRAQVSVSDNTSGGVCRAEEQHADRSGERKKVESVQAAGPSREFKASSSSNVTPELVAALAARSFLHSIVLGCILQKGHTQPAIQPRELQEQEIVTDQRVDGLGNGSGAQGERIPKGSEKTLRSRSKVCMTESVSATKSEKGRRQSVAEAQRSSLAPKSSKRLGRASVAAVSNSPGRSPCPSPKPSYNKAMSMISRKASVASSFQRSASLSAVKADLPDDPDADDANDAVNHCSTGISDDAAASLGANVEAVTDEWQPGSVNSFDEFEPTFCHSVSSGVVGEGFVHGNPFDSRDPFAQLAAIGGELSLAFDMSQIKEDEFGGLCLEAELPHHLAGLFGYTTRANSLGNHSHSQHGGSNGVPWESATPTNNSQRLSFAGIDRNSQISPSDHADEADDFRHSSRMGNLSRGADDLQDVFGMVHGVDVFEHEYDDIDPSAQIEQPESAVLIPKKPAGRPSPKKPARRSEAVPTSAQFGVGSGLVDGSEKKDANRQAAHQRRSRTAAMATQEGGGADKRKELGASSGSRNVSRPRNVDETLLENASNDGGEESLAGVSSSEKNPSRPSPVRRQIVPQLHMKILEEDLYIYRSMDSPCDSPSASAAAVHSPKAVRTRSGLDALGGDAQAQADVGSVMGKELFESGDGMASFHLDEGNADGNEHGQISLDEEEDGQDYEGFSRDNSVKFLRSARLLEQLSTRLPLSGCVGSGSPKKKQTRRGMQNSDSMRTITTNPSYRTLTTDPSCRTLTTDPSYRTLTTTASSGGGALGSTSVASQSSPAKAAAAKETRRRAMRERHWNSGFTQPDRDDDDFRMIALAMEDVPLPHGPPPAGQQMSADSSGIVAPSTVLPPALWQYRALWPSTSDLLGVPPKSESRSGAGRAAANMAALEAPLLDLQSWRQSGLADRVEWYGSSLHTAYLASVEEQSRYGAGDSRTLLAAALEGPHSELRALAQSHPGSEEPAAVVDDGGAGNLSRLHSLLKVLWEELQVPQARRTGTWMHPQQIFAPNESLRSMADHVQALLAYRDATMLVIHGLVEHERLFTQAQQVVDLQEGDQRLTQLRQIDGACVQFLVTWARRFPDPPWLTGGDGKLPPLDSGRRRIFLWQGLDALTRVRADAGSVHPPGSPKTPLLSPLSARQSAGRGHEVSTTSLSTSPPRRRMKGPENCAGRAAVNDSRGLRAMLRSGGAAVGVSQGGGRRTVVGSGWGPTADLRPSAV